MSLPGDAKALQIIRSTLANVAIVFSMVTLIWFSMDLIVNCRETNTLEDLLYTALQIITVLSALGPYLTVIIKKRNTAKIAGTVQEIVDRRIKYQPSMHVYQRTERKCYLVAKWPGLIYATLYVSVTTFSLLGFLIRDLFRGEIDVTKWYNIHKMNPPFDKTRLVGELMYFGMQLQTMLGYFAAYTSCLSMFLSLQFYLEAFCQDLSNNFHKINQSVQRNQLEPEWESQTKAYLIDSIKFHARINRFFEKVSDMVSGIIFFQLLCGAGHIATAIIQVDMAMQNVGIQFFVVFGVMILSVSSVLPYCYFATITLSNLTNNGHQAYGSLWYKLPVDQQKPLLLVIASAQRERSLKGFGIINCSRESFLKIFQAAISYYLMIKRLSGN